MTTNLTGGNVPRERTIDSAGNIIPRPYGVSRWSTPRRYGCGHNIDCTNAAVKVSSANKVHNCCGTHEEGEAS